MRLYFRRKGQPKIRLPAPIGSPDFLAAYKAACAGTKSAIETTSRHTRAAPNSLRWLYVEYCRSAGFKRLDTRTQRVRRGILDRLCERDGSKPFKLLEARHVRKMRDEIADRPEAANALVKALRQLYGYAVEYELVDRNPACDVPYISSGSEGFHSWTLEEIAQYEKAHPVGTPARLALALLFYTGQRRSDVVRFGRQHVKDGKLVFTQHKNRNKKPIRLAIPVIPELQQIIDASPCGDLTFLVTAFNRPFTSNGFGNRFRKWCDEADLPHCSAHGLRKALAARLAELGLSERDIMAVTGHRTSKEVTRYTNAASQVIGAQNAMKALSADQSANRSVPLSDVVQESGAK